MGTDNPVCLILVGNTQQICGGVIKGGVKRFCTSSVDECSVASHSKKYGLVANSWYIRVDGKRPGALLSPFVASSVVNRDDVDTFKEGKKPIHVWRTLFNAMIATSKGLVIETAGEADDAISAIASPTASQISQADEELSTPRDVKLGKSVKVVADANAEFPMLDVIKDILLDPKNPEQDLETALGTIVSEWKKVGGNFERVKEMCASLGVAHNELSTGILRDLKDVERKASVIDNKILILRDRIGHDAKASEGGTKTAWEAIAEINETIGGIASDLKYRIGQDSKSSDGAKRTVWGAIEEQAQRSKVFRVDYNSTMEELNKILQSLNLRLVKQERRDEKPFFSHETSGFHTDMDGLATVNARLQILENIVEELRSTPAPKSVQDFDKMVSKLDHLDAGLKASKFNAEERTRAAKWGGGFGTMNKPPIESPWNSDELGPLGSDLQTLQASAEHFRVELAFLKGKIKGLEAPHRGEAVDFGGHRMSSIEDCRAFLKRTKMDVGCFTDLLSSLVSMGASTQTGKEKADERHSAKRVQTSIRYNNLLASMGASRPEKLYAKSGKGDLVAVSDGFGAIPHYNDWHGTGMDGVKASLCKDLDTYLAGLRGALQVSHGEGPELARALNLQVLNQWGSMMSFFEQHQHKLVNVAKFSTGSAWKLIGRYGIAVFEAMRPYRATAAQLEHPETLEDQSALLWAVLQCHRIMQDFIAVGFEGHPAIVREMSLFMLTERVDPVQFKSLVEKNIVIEKQNASLEKKLNALEGNYNLLKRNHDNLANEVKQLAKKSKTNG